MKLVLINIVLLFFLFSCATEPSADGAGNDHLTTNEPYTEFNPITVFGDETDSLAITWSDKTILGTPSLFISNRVTEMTIEDCTENYCQGTTIYFNELGLPTREVSKNTNSLYFEYEQPEPGIITGKSIHRPDNPSLIFNYDYTKEMIYQNGTYFSRGIISYTDTSTSSIYYNHINDSIKLRNEDGFDHHFDTLVNAPSKYVGVRKIKSLWKMKMNDDQTIDVSVQGDIKIPGGEELGGPLTMKYTLNENNLIARIQYLNQFGFILKEVNITYPDER